MDDKRFNASTRVQKIYGGNVQTFKVIEEYPNFSISQCGKIKNNTSGKILKTVIHKKGYEVINIKPYGRGAGKSLKIHRLVAKAFLPNPLNKLQVNHLDGNKQNNHMNNLEWATASENMKHAFDTGLKTPSLQVKRFTESEAIEIAKAYKFRCRKNGANALAKRFGTSHSVILNTIQRVKEN
jgi:hypothetical protein